MTEKINACDITGYIKHDQISCEPHEVNVCGDAGLNIFNLDDAKICSIRYYEKGNKLLIEPEGCNLIIDAGREQELHLLGRKVYVNGEQIGPARNETEINYGRLYGKESYDA